MSATSPNNKRKTRPIPPERSLAVMHLDLAAQWHPTRNGAKTHFDFSNGSDAAVWWCCTAGGPKHDSMMRINARTTRKQACPYCAGHRVPANSSLAASRPDIAREWHKERNAPLTPADVLPDSSKIFWWHCLRNREHEWQAAIDARTNKTRRGTGCPQCASQRVTARNNLAAKYPNIAHEWHPTKNRKLKPTDVLPSSNKKVWWQCSKISEHEWQMSCEKRTADQSGCPFCVEGVRNAQKIERHQ